MKVVEGEGFEPSKAEPADLQSAPFDRSGIPPAFKIAGASYWMFASRSIGQIKFLLDLSLG